MKVMSPEGPIAVGKRGGRSIAWRVAPTPSPGSGGPPPRRGVWREQGAILKASLAGEEQADDLEVELWIEQDGVFTGCDHGIAFFEDGAFGFTGGRCSFLLGSQDLALSRNREDPDGVFVLVVCHPTRVVRLFLRPLRDTSEQGAYTAKWRFSRQVDEISAAPPFAGDRQLPPLDVQEGAWRSLKSHRRSLATVAAIALSATVAAVSWGAFSVGTGGMAALIPFMPFVYWQMVRGYNNESRTKKVLTQIEAEESGG